MPVPSLPWCAANTTWYLVCASRAGINCGRMRHLLRAIRPLCTSPAVACLSQKQARFDQSGRKVRESEPAWAGRIGHRTRFFQVFYLVIGMRKSTYSMSPKSAMAKVL